MEIENNKQAISGNTSPTASPHVRGYMLEWIDWKDHATALYNDIAERFGSPVLGAALRDLVNAVEQYTTAQERLNMAGYSIDDAIALCHYGKE